MLQPVLPENYLSIYVISLEGNITNIKAKPDFTIEIIKTAAVNYFYSHDKTKLQLQFRLVHSSKFKQLVDDRNINDEEISENDTLLLVEIRPVPVKENMLEETLKGPNEEAILQVTSNLRICNPPRPMSYSDCCVELQSELRKILISLVKASAKILMYSSETQRLYEILQEKFKAKCKPTIDQNTVKTLMEMGYSHKKVLKALCLRKSNITEALTWLIDHQNDPDDDDDNDEDLDLLTIERDTDKYVADPSSSTSARKKSLKDTCIELFKGEMGFEETSIIDALKITGNDQTNACEWLLGERRRSLQDLGEGLDPESPIYKAIMNSPRVQLSLTNPRMLLVVQPPVTLFMGVDKYENEDLIKWGWPEDVWFHVDKYSSAHVYLRLHPGQTIDDIPSTVLEDAAQLVKANSIDGNKINDVDVVYTMWSNLKKTQGMEVGQVGFHKDKDVYKIHVSKRINSIVNRLIKTKRSEQVNFRAEREQRDRNEREDKKKLMKEQKEQEKAKEKQRKEEADMRSYNSLFNTSNMISNTENSGYDSDDFM
ncbi:ubiquitin-associated domain-containing protein 1 isoform X2 [Hylaeus anthracinus]|uniref:ubiquitin-associated domain-containing protein 1 isoform X2 n=1 Tax=Hylaeus anthracinus TaxID=313031 RepID=UPI0023B89D6B|nr:ubiquitin-associated domain-containing protein 1 isoform X2 [Hylaeus anthracinus]